MLLPDKNQHEGDQPDLLSSSRYLVPKRRETEQLGKAEAAVVEGALHHFVAPSSSPRG